MMKFFSRMLTLNGALTCEQVVGLLDRYSDGNLTADAWKEVDLHLRSCAPCRQELKVLDRVLSLVESLERKAPPADMWNRISSEICRPAPVARGVPALPRISAPRSRPFAWPGLALAGVGVAALAGIGFMNFSGSPVQYPNSAVRVVRTGANSIETNSYMSQAEEMSFFDPLVDRASVGAMVEVSRDPQNGTGHARPAISDAMTMTHGTNGASLAGRP